MKQILIIIVVLFSFSANHVLAIEGKEANLNKYGSPAEITKLDWMLLSVQVNSFSEEISWDEFGLIQGVVLHSDRIGNTLFVRMAFTLNKSPYLRLQNFQMKKIFLEVIEGVADIVRLTIPEIEHKKDVHAIFTIIDGSNAKRIAEYENGKLKFIKQ